MAHKIYEQAFENVKNDIETLLKQLYGNETFRVQFLGMEQVGLLLHLILNQAINAKFSYDKSSLSGILENSSPYVKNDNTPISLIFPTRFNIEISEDAIRFIILNHKTEYLRHKDWGYQHLNKDGTLYEFEPFIDLTFTSNSKRKELFEKLALSFILLNKLSEQYLPVKSGTQYNSMVVNYFKDFYKIFGRDYRQSIEYDKGELLGGSIAFYPFNSMKIESNTVSFDKGCLEETLNDDYTYLLSSLNFMNIYLEFIDGNMEIKSKEQDLFVRVQKSREKIPINKIVIRKVNENEFNSLKEGLFKVQNHYMMIESKLESPKRYEDVKLKDYLVEFKQNEDGVQEKINRLKDLLK